MRIAALDQGTTSTRVLVVDMQGRADIQLALRHQQHHPRPGWVEHDPLELLANLQRCLEATGRVDAIGLANQGESCLAWDAISGAPLSPVIVWQDNRSAARIEELRANGAEALTLERAGLPLDAYFSASKLAWIVENLPAAQAALSAGRLRLGTTDAYFLDRLAGVYATDITTASRTSLMNLATGQWDPQLCALFGVPLEALPPIRATVGDFGRIGQTPISASVVDQQASLYGHGCRQPGDAKITFGTGAFALTVTGDQIIRAPEKGLLATIAWQVDGKPVYAMDGGVYDASAAVEWAGRLGLFSDFSELAAFDQPPAISRELPFVPALSGLACPHWDRSAGAVWIGMNAATSRQDLCQAVLEGVALRSAEVITAMDDHLRVTDQLSIDGGLARSPYFAQFLADILQRTIVTQRFDELTALGCAALAARGLGLELPELDNTRTHYQPRVDRTTADVWRRTFSAAVSRSQGWSQPR
ncbi:FGGY family carbohydrate kinase [Pseudomonas chlororaphis]|uniref:glycerol kinase n=1 Tax=Pseudomonas chlororaphis TaxID=587753 RepID=UPI00209B4AD7|nr:glycerol kinase [Pseudomonas chlororaphis]MCO7610189.1 FGGY family carbohydrate kinase [Pseudomonas chlororaphis]